MQIGGGLQEGRCINLNIETSEYIAASLGKTGGKYIDDTSATIPDTGMVFFSITALSNTVISAITGNIDLSGATIPLGTTVYGRWTSITLTSGECVVNQRE